MQQSRQEIEKNNLEAQLSKLKTRTALAVEQTREAVELKEGYLLEVENLENELAEKKQELSEVLSSISTRKKQLEVTENAITEMITKSQADADRRGEVISTLDIAIRDKEAEKGALEKEIDSLESIIPVIQEQVDNNEKLAYERIDQLADEIATKQDELKKLSEGVSDAIVKLDELTTERINLETEIVDAKNRIAAREEELHTIAEEHKERGRELDRKEADFRVIGRRLKREYESVFPNRKLNI
ncbi:hypothetical protein KC850_03525 [Candidatus Kaiserbacteria bacterium]|nr:hypothetical protein [Candidatus Kaiserbacteria bacterium]